MERGRVGWVAVAWRKGSRNVLQFLGKQGTKQATDGLSFLLFIAIYYLLTASSMRPLQGIPNNFTRTATVALNVMVLTFLSYTLQLG